MAKNAFPARPPKKPRLSRGSKAIARLTQINGSIEPPVTYVPSRTVRPIHPTLSDVCPIEGMKTTIISRRYRNKCGDPIFTIRLEPIDRSDHDKGALIKEKEVGFDDIEDFVSPAELERFETTWYDPDEVMPGIVIGAPGFDKTQTWEGPSTTCTSNDGSQPSTSRKKAKRAASHEFIDVLPPVRRRGRSPKKTTAIMRVGAEVSTHDGHQSEEEAYELANIEDEVDLANVRGTGGFALIPSSRSASTVSSQANASPSFPRPGRKLPTMSERSSLASDDKDTATDEKESDELLISFHPHEMREQDSASENQEPDELLMGFNPHRTKTSVVRSMSYASQPRRGAGLPCQLADPTSRSLLEYVESNHISNNTSRKSPTQKPRSPTSANVPAAKAVYEGEDEEDAGSPDMMPATNESIERDELPMNHPSPPASAPAAEVERPARASRHVEVIEISSDSESELSPSPNPIRPNGLLSMRTPVDLSPTHLRQLAEFDRREEGLHLERAQAEATREWIMREREEKHRRNSAHVEESEKICQEEERQKMVDEEERQNMFEEEGRQNMFEEEERQKTLEEEERQKMFEQEESERKEQLFRLAQEEKRRALQRYPAPARNPDPNSAAMHPSPTTTQSPGTTRQSFAPGARPKALAPISAGTSADNAICIDDDEDNGKGPSGMGNGLRNQDINPNDCSHQDNLPDDGDDDNSSITYSERAFKFTSVIDHRRDEDGCFLYLVKWEEKPHPPEDESWFPEDELGAGAKLIVQNYLRELRKPSSPEMLRDPAILLNVRPRWRRVQERESSRKQEKVTSVRGERVEVGG